MMRQALHTFSPDLVHIHNLYPFISPSILPLCKRYGVPVVMTVHNYRLICPTGLFLRDGKPCENCLVNGNERDCIRYNCEQNWFRSIAYTLRNWVARHTKAYLDNVDYFCCLTEFQKEKLIAAGYPIERIRVFPNVVEDVATDEELFDDTQSYVAYVGRHDLSKGDDLLLQIAARHPDISFRFAGIAPEEVAALTTDNITLCGKLDHEQLRHFYRQARFIVIPSRCYEGFPIVLLESFAHGKCCIVPAHGPFPSLIRDSESGQDGGILFRPLDMDDLEQKIIVLWNRPDESKRLGLMARQMAEKRFQRDAVNASWNQFIEQVIAEHKRK